LSSSGILRVAIVGARGRMGRFAADLLGRTAGFEVAATIERADDLEVRLRAAGVRVALDVTRAGLGFDHGRIMLGCGVRPVIGTSGVSLDENARLDAIAREHSLGGLVVPNFSVGMWLLQQAAVEGAKAFDRAEIVEMHHERKKDAPSGTALDTAERMKAARGKESAEVPIHSVRLPGLYAHQVVILGGAGETYTLRHDMSGPEAFATGILASLRHASTAVGVARGIGAALRR
jgi:4-hydroxy-tetrahydrodipicolinate reductase